MLVHSVHVSDILLKTVEMNETYAIHEGAEVDSGQNKEIPTIAAKSKNESCICQTKCLFAFSCLLTICILGGFTFLFGPLVLQRYFPLYKFTPNHINVEYYRLRLQPIDKSTNPSEIHNFKGRVSIIFNNTQRINELRLLSRDLSIETINLSIRNKHIVNNQTMIPLGSLNETGRSYHVTKVLYIPVREYQQTSSKFSELMIMLEKPLEIGDYTLDIYYQGDFHPWGFSRTVYNDTKILKNDKKIVMEKAIVVLKDPSRVFPYFDNEQKVKFELSIERKTNVYGFSNVPFREIEQIKNHTGFHWEHFKTTSKIRPNCFALIIADYKPINVSTTSPVVLKIFAPRKYHDQLSYAREIFPKIFKSLGEYLNIEYPSTKLDILLVDDTSRTQSSKPGLITLNTNDILLVVNLLNENEESRWNIFSKMIEAVALQYLQDNVHEERFEILQGFVKFLVYKFENLAKHKYEDWKYWNSEEYFVANIMETSLNNDILERRMDSRVLRMVCVLRMINDTLNTSILNFGINEYISSNKDLSEVFENIQLSNNSTVGEYFASWVDNLGYPVVTITRTTGWNVLISQENHHPLTGNNFVISLAFISEKSNKVQHLILDRDQIETNLFVPQDEWLLFNYHRRGYYRVNYQLDDWRKLIRQLERRLAAIPVINRAQLISDAFALADDGRLQFHIAFEALNYLRDGNERNYLPWWVAIGGLNRHEAVFLDASGDYGIFRKFKINLLNQIWRINQKLNPKLAELLHTELCKLQYKPCIKSALDFYNTYKYRKDILIPRWVYCTILMHSPDEEFDNIYARLQNSLIPSEIENILQSLTCTRVTYQLNSFLEESFKKPTHAQYIWKMMAKSPMSRLLGLAYLETGVSKIKTTATKAEIALNHDVWKIILEEFLSTMTNEAHLYKLLKIAQNIPESLEEELKTAMGNINRNIQWKREYYSMFVEQLYMKSY